MRGGPRFRGPGLGPRWEIMVAALTVGCGGAAEQPRFMREGAGVVRVERVVASIDPEVDPEAGFSLATDIDLLRDSVIVLDTREVRLHLLDDSLRMVRTIGREGDGPGELRSPWNISVHGDLVGVDGHGRSFVTLLTPEGRGAGRIEGAGGIDDFAWIGQDEVVRVRRSPDYYLEYAGPARGPEPEVRRLLGLYGEEDYWNGGPANIGSTLVEVDHEGRVHLFDNQLGTMLRIGPRRELELVRRIPERVWAEMNEGRALPGDPERRVIGGVKRLADDLSLTDRGDLFLLLHSGPYLGILVDPETYEARVLVSSGDPEVERWVLGAGHALIKGDRLFALNAYGIAALALDLPDR